MGEKNTCAASVSDRGGWHCPQKQKERAERRGPTEYEKTCERARKERARVKALESSHAELLRVCELAVAKWFSGETSEINMELELRSAIHWAKRASEVK